jgi:hypothetical protein
MRRAALGLCAAAALAAAGVGAASSPSPSPSPPPAPPPPLASCRPAAPLRLALAAPEPLPPTWQLTCANRRRIAPDLALALNGATVEAASGAPGGVGAPPPPPPLLRGFAIIGDGFNETTDALAVDPDPRAVSDSLGSIFTPSSPSPCPPLDVTATPRLLTTSPGAPSVVLDCLRRV